MTISVQILSDTHLEFETAIFPKISKVADIIILAGDIDITPADSEYFFKWIRKKTKAPILYVLGNHEYYHQTYPTVANAYKEIGERVSDVYMLEQDTIALKGVRFLGTTMWTWLNDTYGKLAEKNMNDYTNIRKQGIDNEGWELYKVTKRFTYEDSANAYLKSKEWLSNQLAEKFDGPTVVITHHAPSERSVIPTYYADPLNFAYFTDLEPLIKNYQPTLWVHGHMHNMRSYHIDETLVVCNPRGYPSQYGRNGFVEELVLDIE